MSSLWSKREVRAAGIALALLSTAAGAAFGQETASNAASVVDAAAASSAIATVSRTPAVGKTLHVTLGHSIFINTKMRLRRVYVADPAVVTSATLTPNQIVVTAMAPGISSLTLLDETGQAQSYLVSSDIDLDGLRGAMAQQLKGYAVHVDGAGGQITLTGTVPTQAMADAAGKLAGLYAKQVANALVVEAEHPKQVRLQVRILAVDRTRALQLGVNLFNPGGSTNWLGQSTTGQFSSAVKVTSSDTGNKVDFTNPMNFFVHSAQLNVAATIQDLATKQVLQILAEPTITTVSGEKANFLSGGEFPVPIVQPGGNGGAAVVTVQFRPFGVKVEFTPYVNPDGTVRLKVSPEVSALDYTNAVTVSGFTIPALSTRRAETDVELRSEQSFAISGLLDQRTTDAMNKNPGAANIPVLGYLFKSKNASRSTTELVIIVTPTVVDPLTEKDPPKEPALPIAPLDRPGFDDSLGKNLNPKPVPPPIHPLDPPFGGPAVGAPAPAAGAPAASSDEAKPAEGGNVAPAPAKGDAAGVAPADAAPSAAVTGTKDGKPHTRVVEVMALSHESDAEAMLDALRRQGYEAKVDRTQKDALLHISVGPFESTAGAEDMRARLVHDGYGATIR